MYKCQMMGSSRRIPNDRRYIFGTCPIGFNSLLTHTNVSKIKYTTLDQEETISLISFYEQKFQIRLRI